MTSGQVRKKADKYEHEEMESMTASHRSNNQVQGATTNGAEDIFIYLLNLFFSAYLK